MKLRCRKGISMVEVVIALVIISIISASALSMVIMAVNVEGNAVRAVEISESLDNTIDCFRFAQSDDEFLEALQRTADFTQAADGSFLWDAGGYTVTIRADLSANFFVYTAVDGDGEEIYSFVFPADRTAEGGAAE